jgi:aminoglycoside 6'-N-acetyltransferase
MVVELDGDVVGLIQYHEETDPDYRHAGVDMFLAESARGQGYGREALLLVAGHLFEQRGHHRLTIDPAADNEPAIRCYAAAGFRTVGVMRRYERGRDGSFHDGLLMELVRPDQPAG